MNNLKNKFEKKDVFKYITKYKFYIICILIFAICGALISIVSPKIIGMAINEMSQARVNLDNVLNIVIWLFAIYSFYAFSGCLGSYFSAFVAIKINYDIRKDIFDKMGRMSLEYINANNYGDILSRVMNDIDILSSSVTRGISEIIAAIIVSFGTLFMMFYISWQMSLVSILVLPLMAIIILIVVSKSQKYFKQYQSGVGKINGFIEEAFSQHEVIRVFDKEDRFKKEFTKINGSMCELSWKSSFFSGLASPMIDFISKITFVVSCVMGGYYATTAALTLGDISAFISYSGKFTQPLTSASGIISAIQQAFAALERISEFFNAPGEAKFCDSSDNKAFDVNKNYDIELENLSFGYNEDKDVIKNLSFRILKGQKVAIVGETGAGKTTLVNVLMRFYDNFKGKILLKDNQGNVLNIRNIDLAEYRKLFGLVTQDSWLYSGTIMENIRYGNENATDEEVKEAAEFVGVSHFINSLPQGYESVIEEEASNISEGEKQLICMARMFLSKVPVLIMDEATSFVDVFTENQIQKSLSKIMEEKTALIIAHRLNTIRNADVILFLEKGEIAEYGLHSELMAKKGKYYEMYSSQFER